MLAVPSNFRKACHKTKELIRTGANNDFDAGFELCAHPKVAVKTAPIVGHPNTELKELAQKLLRKPG